jgi:hypothetical protein
VAALPDAAAAQRPANRVPGQSSDTEEHKMSHNQRLLQYCLRRLGAAFMVGTDEQIERWLAAVEQSRRRVALSTTLH